MSLIASFTVADCRRLLLRPVHVAVRFSADPGRVVCMIAARRILAGLAAALLVASATPAGVANAQPRPVMSAGAPATLALGHAHRHGRFGVVVGFRFRDSRLLAHGRVGLVALRRTHGMPCRVVLQQAMWHGRGARRRLLWLARSDGWAAGARARRRSQTGASRLASGRFALAWRPPHRARRALLRVVAVSKRGHQLLGWSTPHRVKLHSPSGPGTGTSPAISPPSGSQTAGPPPAAGEEPPEPASSLLPGERLHAGDGLRSPNGEYRLIMQGDGNLVLRREGKALWASNTAGHSGADVVMQGDGNLVIYESGKALWNSSTADFPGAYLALQDDGNAVIYHEGHAIWARDGGYIGDAMSPGIKLHPGAYLLSRNHGYKMIMQGDGNLVLRREGKALWASNTAGHSGADVVMQGDGNLVIYESGKALWNTHTNHHPGAHLLVQNDGNVVIYDGGAAIWDRKDGNLTGGGGSTGAAIVSAAASQAGKPYCFDGGDEHGPTHGSGNIEGATQCGSRSIVGFDCTGLTQYAAYQGTGGAVDLTHHNSEQARYAPGQWITSESSLRPGDIVYFGYSRDDITHSAIYAGIVGGQQMIWDADIAFWIYPDGVHERTLASENSLGFVGAARF